MGRPSLEISTHGGVSVAGVPGNFTARARFRDPDGIVRLVERTRPTKGSARAALAGALAERVTRSRDSELGGSSTVTQLLEAWWTFKLVDAPGLSTSTRIVYIDILDRILKPQVGSLRIREVTTGRIDRWLVQERAAHPAQADLARSLLSQAFTYGARRDITAGNPILATSKTKAAKPKPRALTDEELARFRAAVRAPRKRGNTYLPDVFDVQLGLGLRISECLSLTIEDLDLDNVLGPRVNIRSTICAAATPIFRQPHVKGGPDGARQLIAPGWVVDILHRRAVEAGASGLLFATRNDGLINPHHVQQAWLRLRDAADLSWVTPHTLRRTSITRIANQFTNEIASAFVNHSSVAITERHYIEAQQQLSPDVREALDRLGPPPHLTLVERVS
jgi:integrase